MWGEVGWGPSDLVTSISLNLLCYGAGRPTMVTWTHQLLTSSKTSSLMRLSWFTILCSWICGVHLVISQLKTHFTPHPHPNLARSHMTIHWKCGCIEHGVRIVFSVLESDSSLWLSLKMRIACYREVRLVAGKTGFRPHPPDSPPLKHPLPFQLPASCLSPLSLTQVTDCLCSFSDSAVASRFLIFHHPQLH